MAVRAGLGAVAVNQAGEVLPEGRGRCLRLLASGFAGGQRIDSRRHLIGSGMERVALIRRHAQQFSEGDDGQTRGEVGHNLALCPDLVEPLIRATHDARLRLAYDRA